MVIGIDVMLMASQGRPGSNQAQNDQWRNVMNALKIKDKDLIIRIHDELKKYPPMDYQELLDFVRSFLR